MDNGITCPYCKSSNNRVKMGTYTKKTNTYRRKRLCLECGEYFHTIETIKDSYESATKIAKGILELIESNLLIEKEEEE